MKKSLEIIEQIRENSANKYTAKPYGEKTREKINQAAKEKAGCAFYITPEYFTDTLHIVPLDKNGFSGTSIFRYDDFEIMVKWENGERPRVLNNNKLSPLPLDKFAVSNCKEYTENTRELAEKIRADFAELKKAREEYERKCSAFNTILPSGIDHRNPYPDYFGDLI